MNTIKYLQFEKGHQTLFLRTVKNASFSTWNKFAEFFNVNRSMVFLYLSEKSKLPYKSYLRLLRKSNIDPKPFCFRIISSNDYGVAEIPTTYTDDLAWFVGILLGDGHIDDYNYQVTIAFHSVLESSYLKKVKALIERLFKKGVSENTSKRSKASYLRLNSKIVVDFLATECGIPTGKRIRTSNNRIPEVILNNPSLLRSCICGIFDSEGGLHSRHHKAARICIYNKCPVLLESVQSALLKLGYHVQLKVNCVKLGRTSEIIRFFEEIKPQNNYKLIKYNEWRKSGRVPSTAEVERYLIGEHKVEASYGSVSVVEN
ncbi:hypothetical protein J4207_06685 [Candidatus Woesearchaeota archaeon]|nr:hypothetical protein [Candidatus Woesearchaeota archaeon]